MWNERDHWLLPRYPRVGVLGGVCAGIAVRFGWNTKLVRVLAVLGLIFGGIFPLALVYLLLWYLMDPAPGHPDTSAPVSAGRSAAPTGLPLAERYVRIEQRLRRLETCVSSREFELRREIGKLG